MLQASVQLYKNAYKGLSRPMWWLALVTLVNRSGTMVIPFLTVYLTSKGYSLAEAGLVMSTFGMGAIVGSFIGGKLTDRIGFHYVQFCSLLLNGILFFVLSTMQTLGQIAACIFVLSSLGEAFRPANATAIAAYSSEANRIRCYSLNRLAVNLGWAIGPAMGGLLASISYTWLFWVDGSTCIIASFLLLIFLPPHKTKVSRSNHAEEMGIHSSAYKDKLFLTGMIFVFMVALCFFQVFSIVPVFYKEQVHLKEAVIGAILALNGIVIALVEMVLVYSLEKKGYSMRYIVIGALLIGTSFLVLSLSAVLSIALLSILIITFGEMFLFPFVNNFWVSRSTYQNRGQYAAVFNISFALAQVLAPLLGAQVVKVQGYNILWLIDFIICGFAAIGFFFLQKNITTHGRI